MRKRTQKILASTQMSDKTRQPGRSTRILLFFKMHDFLFSPADFGERGDSAGGDGFLLGDATARNLSFHAVGKVNERIHVTLRVTLRKRVLDLVKLSATHAISSFQRTEH